MHGWPSQHHVFKQGQFPFTYLGLPMGTTRPSVLDLMPVVHAVERKTSTALSLMSSGAKLTLVNSIVTSMLIYAMCTIKLHPKVVEHLDKLRCYCLWAKNSDDGVKNISLAAWELVCRPKRCGGLGVIDIKTQNVALLLKHMFKFYNHADVPWVELIWNTYYSNKIPHAVDTVGSFWWKDIMQLNGTFRGITKVVLGDGSSYLFWKDVWLEGDGDETIMEMYPRAFSYCLNEDDSITKVLTATDPASIFSLSLSIQAREEVRQIQLASMHVGVVVGSHDTWDCTLGRYSSKKFYEHCFKEIVADEAFGWLWKAKSPIKFKMFGWLLLVARLNTRNMLKHRHFAVAGNNYACLLCQTPPKKLLNTCSSYVPLVNGAGAKLGCPGQSMAIDWTCCAGGEKPGDSPSSWTSSSWQLGAYGWSETINTSEGCNTPSGLGLPDSSTSLSCWFTTARRKFALSFPPTL